MLTCNSHSATLVTEPVEGVEITWEVPYCWSKPIPATYLDPPEGGLELDGEPRPVAVTYYGPDGQDVTIEGIQPGSILDALLVERYGFPIDDECWEAAGEANHDRMEDTRW